MRGDSGFCRDEIMSYCEQNEKVDYVLGLAKNERLNKGIEAEMAQAQQLQQQTRRRGCLKIFVIARAKAGRASGGWWARRNTWLKEPTRDSL